MTAIKDVITILEKKAHPSLQESYDNAGLITGDSGNKVTGVLVSLDCTEEVIDEAIKLNCNLIVSHHPILFKPISGLTGKNYVERCLIKAIKNNIGLYAIHTNLDSIMGGVNSVIASRLGLKKCRILRPNAGRLKKLVTFCPSKNAAEVRTALFNAGGGTIGNYDHCSFNAEGHGTFRGGENSNPFVGKSGEDHTEKETRIEIIYHDFRQNDLISALQEAHPYEEVAYDIYPLQNQDPQHGMGMIGELNSETDIDEFLLLLKDTFNAKGIRHTKAHKKKVKSIAVCGGSGGFLLKDAIGQKADVFVTSDIKYHEYFDADGSIILADIGHFESEQFSVEIIADVLKEKFITFATHFSTVNTNPINYF